MKSKLLGLNQTFRNIPSGGKIQAQQKQQLQKQQQQQQQQQQQ